MIIRSKRIYAEDGVVDGYLVVEDGKVKDICDMSANLTADIDATDKMVIPGIFDTHNHGALGYTLMDTAEDSKAEIKGYLKGIASQGVTNVFPSNGTNVKMIAEVAREENDGATIVGIHSEGPYLNRVGEKGINTGYPEVDIEFVKQMVKDGDGLLKLVALAPEIEGTDEVIEYLTSQGIRVAFAHSDCNYGEAKAAFDKGISVSTHTANVMSGIHHRNMGGLGACLLNEDVWCEAICDDLYGRYQVTIGEDGFCLSDTGRLMGSTKPVLYGMGVLHKELGIPMETVVQMASLNPCIVYGLDKEKGSLAKGKDADFVVISDDYQALYTYCNGRKVYDYQVDTDVFNPKFLKQVKIS